MFERTTHKDRPVDGVEIYPILKYRDSPSKLVLIKNFRVPVGKMCIEVPAGLVDANESVENAAVRELKEETGYDGIIKKILPISQIDQWKSRENTQLIFMEIDGDLEINKNPKPNLEETEYIEVFLVPLDDPFPIIDSIFINLNVLEMMNDEGCLISTHLQSFLYGLNFRL